MKHIFAVKLRSSMSVLTPKGYVPVHVWHNFEVVAETAIQSIRKATSQARREHSYRGAYVVVRLKHRGPAI